MDQPDNKILIEEALAELSRGNYEAFFNLMADDMRWTWMGSKDLAKTFEGKLSVVNDLWGSVKTSLKQPYVIEVKRLIAEGDFIVVESEGRNSTLGNRQYNNRYCWVCVMSGGKLKEVREYMDTGLVLDTFSE